MTAFKRFLMQHTFLAIVTFIAAYIWNIAMPAPYQSYYPYLLIVFFYVSTSLLHLMLSRSSSGNPQQFIRMFIASITIKFMVYLMIIILFLFINRKDAVPFIVSFLILYLIFTSFEVIKLYRQLK